MNRPIAGWLLPVACGLIVFVLLAARFSPNWILFYEGFQDAKRHAASEADRQVIERIFKSSFPLLRGAIVAKQVADLNVEISSPPHKIVRWRLLAPAIGHYLGLPGWSVLGFAHLGCVALVVVFVTLGYGWSPDPNRPSVTAACLGVVAGASAPFFTSMSWLGYYDSCLALALVGVAFARARWLVALACLLAPWIDERFVIGLPLALCVRFLYFDRSSDGTGAAWFRTEALLPILLVTGYSLFRLKLGGTGSSQTVGAYFRDFVLTGEISVARRLYGAWEGLRVGWVLVAMAIIGPVAFRCLRGGYWPFLLPGVSIMTAAMAAVTAQDVSRSMVLLVPVVLLGWLYACRSPAWVKYRAPHILAVLALILPATQVTGNLSIPIDNLWSSPRMLSDVQNNLGVMYMNGDELPRNHAEAVRLLRKAAVQGSGGAAYNLGLLSSSGTGVPLDHVEAFNWYRKAAAQGHATAQMNLGGMYFGGSGVKQDYAQAIRWFQTAAEQGVAEAEVNLGRMNRGGIGMPQHPAAAAVWFRKAADRGHAPAQSELGAMYAIGAGVPQDYTEAVRWFRKAAAQGDAEARCNLGKAYEHGLGLPKDGIEALAYYHLAAESGHGAAKEHHARLENLLGPEAAVSARRRSEQLRQ